MGRSTRTGGDGSERRDGARRAAPDAPLLDARARERARVRAYLDLWERHLVQIALNGPDGEPLPHHRQPPR